MNRNEHRKLTRNLAWGVRVALIGSFWLAFGCLWSQTHSSADDAGSAAPSWRQGISAWNGDSYNRLGETTSLADTETSSEVPYSVPIDPNYYSAPTVNEPQPTSPAADPVPVSSVPSSESSEIATPLAKPEIDQSFVEPVAHDDLAVAGSIGDAIEHAIAVEQPPLHEETLRWYQYPWRWVTTGWTNHAEFGLDGSAGNAETLALQTGVELKRKTDAYTLAIDVDYRLVTNRSVRTEDNGRFNIDYDRLLGESRWAMFGKYGLEWDTFKAFDLRLNLNGGASYHWIRNDRSSFVSRFGAGASREFGAPIDEWTPEAVFGLEAEHQLNRANKLKGKVDYFPAWEDFDDYRIVTDLAWEILLDDADNLSLKFAVTDRYDNTPQGAEPNDFYYSVLLLVKF